MASNNFMKQLINEAAATTTKTDVIETTAEIVEESTVQEPTVRYAGEDEEPTYLKVSITDEKILEEGDKRALTLEEVSEKYGIQEHEPIPAELMDQVQMDLLGVDSLEELNTFKMEIEVISERTAKLREMYFQDLKAKGIDSAKVPFRHYREWLKVFQSKSTIEADELAVIEPIHYNPTLSENYHYATEKIMKEIFLKDAPATNTLSTDSKKDDVYITYELKLEDGYEISSPLEPIDRDLIEAIGNLLKNSNTNCLKLVTIYRELTHNPKATMTEKIEENLLQMLRRCASKRLLLDVSKEAKYSEKKTEWKSLKNKIYFDEQVLNWRAAKGESLGFSDDDMYIEFLTYPVLLRYAEAKGNVRTIESNILNVRGLKNTNENIVIRNYLSREIKWMKTGKRTRRVGGKTVLNNAISFDTVLEYAGISDLKGVERQRKKDVIEKILNYWTDCKWIDGFTTDKASRTSPVKGFTIKLSKKTMDS